MKILFVYDSISKIGGGSQLAVFTWLRNLKKMGVQVKLLCNHNAGNLPLAADDLIKMKATQLNFLLPEYSASFFLSPKVKAQILDFNPDIIQLNEPQFTSLAIIKLARKNNYPVVSFFHTNYANVDYLAKTIIWPYQRLVLNRSDLVIAPSCAWKKEIKNSIHRPIAISQYPIASYFFKAKKIKRVKTAKRLITISRLSNEKKIDFLIKLMSYLADEFSLTIVGDGKDRAQLEALGQKLNLTKSISFLGWVANSRLPALLKEHDLFISASSFETFGITYIEALATGLPVIAVDYPVAREVIPEHTAVLINKYDAKTWAEKILNINKKNHYQQLLSAIKQNYADLIKFEEKKSTQGLINLYKRLLAA